MVAVVQLVERQVVILDVAGSSPVSHPKWGAMLAASWRAGSAPEFAAQSGSAHLQLEPTRRGGVTDCAGGDAYHLPQHNATECGQPTAPFGFLAPTQSSTHINKATSANCRLHG
jgi:hypothetical protein